MILTCLLVLFGPQALSDVPAAHWAGGAVQEVVSKGVMKAPGGRFEGGKTVTRRELAITLAAFGQALTKGPWPGSGAKPVKTAYRDKELRDDRPVTRYELAAVLSRAGRYVEAGLPRPGKKPPERSEAFPPRPKVTVPKSDAAYAAVTYLVSKDMALGGSVALKPSNQAVTPRELATAVAAVLVGLTEQVSDEPQNREDITPPPHKHRKP